MLYPRCLFTHKTEDCSNVDFMSFNGASGSEGTLADVITLTDRSENHFRRCYDLRDTRYIYIYILIMDLS